MNTKAKHLDQHWFRGHK